MNHKGILFGGGARRVVVDREESDDDERSEETITTRPGLLQDSGLAETRSGSGSGQSRLVVPKTVERQGRRESAALSRGQTSRRKSVISQEYVPQTLASPVPFASSRLSVSLGSGASTSASERTGDDDTFLLAWINSVLDPWGFADSTATSPSSVAIHTHKDVLRDRMARQWAAMDSATRATFVEPIGKISERLARNPLRVAKAMEAVARTAVTKHAVMEALGSYSRVWFDVASGLLADIGAGADGSTDGGIGSIGSSIGSSNGSSIGSSIAQSRTLADALALSPHEKEWLHGLMGRHAGKSARLQAFAKLSPEGYCRVALHVIAVASFLDGVFASTAWTIPVWAPPLFCRSTSSKEVVQNTVGYFLDETSDVHRWLKRSDYRVSYVQPVKQRSSFGVENMAVDLRDGVALCRLAELLVPECERLKPLQPVTNTSERICNIDLALSKLGMRDYVEARLIADGDRASTTGLLWNCIVRFELETTLNLNAIAAEVTRLGGGVVVGCAGMDVDDAFLRSLLVDTGSSAASHVMRWACCLYNTVDGGIIAEDMSDHPLGGPLGRRRVLESFLAHYGVGERVEIGIGGRGIGMGRREGLGAARGGRTPTLSFMKKVDYLLKPLGKGHGVPRIFSEDELLYSDRPLDQRRLIVMYAMLLKRVLSVYHEQHAAAVIQRSWRRHVMDQRAPDFARKHLKTWIDAATIIQRNVRPFLARQRIEASRASREAFVGRIVSMQAIWRQKMQRAEYEAMRHAVIVIQPQWRAHAARRELEARAARVAQETAAATTLQAHWRGFAARRAFDTARNAAISIQSAWRMAPLREAFVDARLAAVVVQKHARRMLAERDLRAREEACVVVQTAWRAWNDRNAFLETQAAAITIQSAWRMANGREVSARRLEAVRTVQRHWRALHQRRVDTVAEALQVATDELVAALTEFAAAARADLLVDKAELRRTEAAVTIQSAWREHQAMESARSTSQYLMDVYSRASSTVKEREAAAQAAAEAASQAAREDAAARTIQVAWRERALARRAYDLLMQMYDAAKETARLNEQYGAAVVTIQAQVRGYLVRDRHPRASAFAAIRDQLQAATDRAEVLRRESIDDPTTLGNMTRVALEGLRHGSDLPEVRVLQDLARCLGSSKACCELFLAGSGVQHLTSALIKVSRDRMREDSVEQALASLEALASCGRFSDRAGAALLEKDGEDTKRLFHLLFQFKDAHELFHALIGALCAVGKGGQFCRAVASSEDLSGSLRAVHRAVAVKQSQVASYLANLQGRRGSEVSMVNAGRALHRLEKLTAGLVALMDRIGVEDGDGGGALASSATRALSSPAPRKTATKTRSFSTPASRARTPVPMSTPVPMLAMTTPATVTAGTTVTTGTKAVPASAHKTPHRRVLGNISNLQLN